MTKSERENAMKLRSGGVQMKRSANYQLRLHSHYTQDEQVQRQVRQLEYHSEICGSPPHWICERICESPLRPESRVKTISTVYAESVRVGAMHGLMCSWAGVCIHVK